jgi:hypothetical protein
MEDYALNGWLGQILAPMKTAFLFLQGCQDSQVEIVEVR